MIFRDERDTKNSLSSFPFLCLLIFKIIMVVVVLTFIIIIINI